MENDESTPNPVQNSKRKESEDNQSTPAAKKKEKSTALAEKKKIQSANVEAAQLRAKTFFNAVSAKPAVVVDLSTDTDEPAVVNIPVPKSSNDKPIPPPQAGTNSLLNSPQSKPNSHINITPQTSPTHTSPPKASSTPIANTRPQTHVHPHTTISPTRETAPISSYMGLLSDQVDPPRDSLANVLGGAIRKSYDVDEPQRLNGNFAAKPLPESAACSNCAIYKLRNEELQAQLEELKQKCSGNLFSSAPPSRIICSCKSDKSILEGSLY